MRRQAAGWAFAAMAALLAAGCAKGASDTAGSPEPGTSETSAPTGDTGTPCTPDAWFTDADGDGVGAGEILFACDAPPGTVALDGDCDDDRPDVYPGAPEACDGVDQDCDLEIDEGTSCADDDGDGLSEDDGDCDDDNASTYPGAEEIADGVDQDCDGDVDEGTTAYDDDGDCVCEIAPCQGSVEPGCAAVTDGDCDDADADVSPLAAERCNEVDDDCDGVVDEDDAEDAATWYADLDADGYGDGATPTRACAAPSGFVADDTDCDDLEATANPGAAEVCDELDNDCDGDVDEDVRVEFFLDGDGDGYGSRGVTTSACTPPPGFAATDDDCDDLDPNRYPRAPELCDGQENGCEGGWSPELEDGTVSRFDATGLGEDHTVAWSAGADGAPAAIAADGGTWEICAGTFYVAVELADDAVIRGRGAERTVLAGGAVARVLSAAADLELADLAVVDGAASEGALVYGGDGDLAIRDAVLTRGTAEDRGAAVRWYDLTAGCNNVALERVSITDNVVETYPGPGAVMIVDCTFVDLVDVEVVRNSSAFGPGGVYVESAATTTVAGARFEENPGGGLRVDGGSTTTVTDSVFYGNAGDGLGGLALAQPFASLTLTDVEIEANERVGGSGGGLYAQGGDIALTRVSVTDNTSGDDVGGAELAAVDSVAVVDSVFARNTAADDVGGLQINSDSVLLEGVVCEDNAAPGYVGGAYVWRADVGLEIVGGRFVGNDGGGLHLEYVASAVLTDVEIAHNTATYGGGLDLSDVDLMVIEGATAVHHNEASLGGGGMYAVRTVVEVGADVVFEDNAAPQGGAFQLSSDTTLALAGSAVRRNTATTWGGAVYIGASTASVSAVAADLGEGETDNVAGTCGPDVCVVGSGFDYGAASTFTCTYADGCL